MGKHSIIEHIKQIKQISLERYGDHSFAAEIFQNALLQMFAVMPEDQQLLVIKYADDIISNVLTEQ